MKTRRIDLGLAVLGSISRLSKQSDRLTKPVLDDIKRDLKQRYGEEFSDTWLLEKISKLEDMGLVKRARGILRNGRETVYTTKRGENIALTLIKLSDEEAFVHNGWEGIVYDPPLREPSVERTAIENVSTDEITLPEVELPRIGPLPTIKILPSLTVENPLIKLDKCLKKMDATSRRIDKALSK